MVDRYGSDFNGKNCVTCCLGIVGSGYCVLSSSREGLMVGHWMQMGMRFHIIVRSCCCCCTSHTFSDASPRASTFCVTTW